MTRFMLLQNYAGPVGMQPMSNWAPLNRAIAAAMADGPAAGLKLLKALDEPLAGHYRLDAVRAHLLEMGGDARTAVAHYRAAASRTTSIPEQHYLTLQAARLSAVSQSGACTVPEAAAAPESAALPESGTVPGSAVVPEPGTGAALMGCGRAGTRRMRTTALTVRAVMSASSPTCSQVASFH